MIHQPKNIFSLSPLGYIGILSAIFAIYLATTSYYSFSYLIFAAIGAFHIVFSTAFASYFSRIILSLLIISASIMIAGFLILPFSIALHPLLVLATFTVIILMIRLQTSHTERGPFRFFDKNDLFSIPLSLLAPIILFSSFSLSPSGVFRIAAEGWDNGSHIIMLQDAAIHERYLYGPYESLKKELITRSNAYPQSWHLATANAVQGFGHNLLNPSKVIHTTYVYIGIITAWMVIASYCFSRAIWFVATRFIKYGSMLPSHVVLLAIINILIQMIVIWGSYVSGFSNFIGMIAYLSVLTAFIIDSRIENVRALLSATFLFGVAAILCWFLPAPGIIISALLLLPILLGINRVRTLWSDVRSNIVSYVLPVMLLILSLIQIVIFVLFSSTGSEQLNAGVETSATDVVNGVFPVSQLFFVGVSVFTLWYWNKEHKLESSKAKLIMAVTLPFIALSAALYFYQTITTGTTSYYLPKLMGTALIPLGIFFAPAFVFWIKETFQKNYRISNVSSLMAGVFILSLFVVASNQSAFGASKLLERNSRISEPVAKEVVSYLRSANHSKQNIIIMRGDENRVYEDRNGKFESRVIHKRLNCSYKINSAEATIDERIQRLAMCADKLVTQNKSITVITSNRTEEKIENLYKSNIIIKNVPDS